MKKWSIVAALLVVATIAALPAAAGGNGSNRVQATIAFEGGDAAARIAPAYGATVNFAIDPVAVKDRDLYKLWVANYCWHDGNLVLAEYHAVRYPSYRDGTTDAFTLASSAWSAGAGECTAQVWMWPDPDRVLSGASMSYSVG
jgi:hypothetical protein